MPLPFYISAAVAVDVDYVKENVHAAVRAALANAFSFARRSFGAPVSKAEVLATIQRVPGVIAADLNTLDTQQPASLGSTQHALNLSRRVKQMMTSLLHLAQLLAN